MGRGPESPDTKSTAPFSMNKSAYLGEFEHMVLLVVLRLGDDAHGMSIRKELDARAGRTVSRSTAYITLERLTRKSYLTARMGDPSDARGGKPKRYFRVTEAGRAALRTSGRALMRLWDGYEALLEEG